MRIEKLNIPSELQNFLDFGQTVYRDNSYWVPPDPHHLLGLLNGEAPVREHADAQAFAATDNGGEIQARIQAVVDRDYNRHWDEATGHLLFFEALPERREAAVAVMRAGCEWLAERGCDAARLSFLGGWQLPLTVDAYDRVPTFAHTYNPAFYHGYIKDAGFFTERGLVEYTIEFNDDLAQRYRDMVVEAERNAVVLRSWDFDKLEAETVLFRDMTNETFAEHWGMPPFAERDLDGFTMGLKDMLVPEFCAFAESGGQTIGYVYCLPDLNQAVHGMKGKDPHEHGGEFQRQLGRIDHGVLLVVGVKKSHRGRGINTALGARSYLAMIERGYKSGSYTVVLDDNWASRRTGEKLGGRVTRNYVTYRCDLR